MTRDIFQQMVDQWPSPAVARQEAPKFSGGGCSSKLLANHDSQGTGPKDKFFIGTKVMYTASSLADWLRNRSKQEGGETMKDKSVLKQILVEAGVYSLALAYVGSEAELFRMILKV